MNQHIIQLQNDIYHHRHRISKKCYNISKSNGTARIELESLFSILLNKRHN